MEVVLYITLYYICLSRLSWHNNRILDESNVTSELKYINVLYYRSRYLRRKKN